MREAIFEKNILSAHGTEVFYVQAVSSDWFCAAVNFEIFGKVDVFCQAGVEFGGT